MGLLGGGQRRETPSPESRPDVLTVGMAFTPRSWRRELRAHVIERLAPFVLCPVQSEAHALDLGLDVLVVDDDTSFLTGELVGRLREVGVAVVGIYEPGPSDPEGYGATYLRSLGVNAAAPCGIGPARLASLIHVVAGPRDDPPHDSQTNNP